MSYFFDQPPSTLIKEFGSEESKAIVQKWMEVFAKNRLGYNTKAYKWHIFPNGFPAIEGNDALLAYNDAKSSSYVVMSNDEPSAILLSEKPDDCLLSDYYVFPENFAWTMAFTHEEGWLGPYFAKHPDYVKLDIRNQEIIKKKEQIQLAKAKGWV